MPPQPSILAIEAACLTAWPAIRVVYDGNWVWRFARGYTKRANSVQSLDPADDGNAVGRIEALAGLSVRNGIAPIFRVTPLAGPGVVAALDRLGWEPFEESCVLGMPLDGPVPTADDSIRFFDPSDPVWIDAELTMSGASDAQASTLRELAELIAAPSAGVLALDADGRPVAAALAVQAMGVGIYLNVVTDPRQRRAGHGRRVMQAALAWTRSAGAHYAAIQVLAENAPAVMLYTSLGFSERYRYHYRMSR